MSRVDPDSAPRLYGFDLQLVRDPGAASDRRWCAQLAARDWPPTYPGRRLYLGYGPSPRTAAQAVLDAFYELGE